MASRILSKIIADTNKKYSEEGSRPIASTGSEVPEIEFIPSQSHAINYLLGGGWYKGKMHEAFGGEHAGKSTLANIFALDMIRYHKKPLLYMDIEHRFNPDWARKLGLDTDNDIILIQPRSAEDATDIMREFITSNETSGTVYDSVGASTTKAINKTFDEANATYGGAASVISRQVNVLAPIASLHDHTMFYINQIRANMDGYFYNTPGGHALKHRLSARIYLRRGNGSDEKQMVKTPDGPQQVGFAMLFRLVKGFGPTPRDQWSDFYFEPSKIFDKVGFDTALELQRLGITKGVIERRGAWYYYEDIKGQGRDKFFAELQKAGKEEQLAADIMATLSGVNEDLEVDLDPDLMMPESDDPEIVLE